MDVNEFNKMLSVFWELEDNERVVIHVATLKELGWSGISRMEKLRAFQFLSWGGWRSYWAKSRVTGLVAGVHRSFKLGDLRAICKEVATRATTAANGLGPFER